MEEITLLRDFAIIMTVAGVVTLLFRKLRQPLILGYLIAGLIVGPYLLPIFYVQDIDNIRLVADLGLVLILFSMGLEFSWSKIRKVGFSVLVIGIIEIVTMISLGYGLGQLLGWPEKDSLFLGAALHISSSAIIVKLLRDLGWFQHVSSKLVIGVLVVEDFAAIVIIAVISGFAGSDAMDLSNIGFILLKMFIFTLVTLVLGTIAIPKIIKFTRQFHSNEALLITSLGLCFAMALFGKYMGLSVAIGAFLMGALIGDTEDSEEIVRILTPVRQMFAALFFVAIGMLIDLAKFQQFALPALTVAVVFIMGKIAANTIATFLSGQNGRTSLQVGMSMPQMGEFSLIITRIGVERKIVTPNLYPIIALVTAITVFAGPYITRSADHVAGFLERRAPPLLRIYISRMADWLKATRMTFSSNSIASVIIRHAVRSIVINLSIVIVIIGISTFSLPLVESSIAPFIGIRYDLVGLILGSLALLFCLPSFFVIARNGRHLADYVVTSVLGRRFSGKSRTIQTTRIVLRDTIFLSITILIALWFIPFMLGLFSIGSFALAVPALLITFVLAIVLWSIFDIHEQLERTVSKLLIGGEHISSSRISQHTGFIRLLPGKLINKLKFRGKRDDKSDSGEEE